MTAANRSLRVESFEDRALPSTLFSFGHIDMPIASFNSGSATIAAHGRASSEFRRDAIDSLARAFRSHEFRDFSGRAFEHSFAWADRLTVFVVLYVESDETNRQPVVHETPATEPVVTPRQFSSAEGGGLDRVPADRGKATNVSPPTTIAIPPLASAASATVPVANVTNSAAFVPAVDGQPRVSVSGVAANSGLGGPLVFLGADPEEGIVVPPTEVPIPPAPIPDIVPPAPPGSEQSTGIAVASFAAKALSGALPFNLAALEAGTREVLSHFASLDAQLPETAGTDADYWWLATAALVTGGVASTIRGNRSQRTDRRSYGFDSVLARWGERNDGRFN